jgi:DNA (cytosine-5)-methyltransferase 1
MQIIDLFSGIGGFSLAGRWMGWETIQFCEIDKYCQGILNQHFPNVPIHNNIKTLTGEQIKTKPNEPIILVGGFPCQPYSVAGKRKGNEDDRHLWPEMLRIIQSISPNYVVGENVGGLLSWSGGLVFEQVCVDLEAIGYEVQPFIIPAAGVNAPHKRNRIWFVAKNTNRSFNGGLQAEGSKREHGNLSAASKMGNGNVTDTTCFGYGRRNKQSNSNKYKKRQIYKNIKQYRYRVWGEAKGRCKPIIGNPACLRCNYGSDNRETRYIQGNKWIASKNKQEWHGWLRRIGKTCNAPNAYVQRLTQPNLSAFDAEQGYNDKFDNAAIPSWDKFPTQSPICGRNDGISNRVDRIKALGNAIVPQVALQIFKAIQEIENNY